MRHRDGPLLQGRPGGALRTAAGGGLPERVFLTGGTGLAGSHVADRLRGTGTAVRALHRPTSEVGHLASLGCELVEGDVRDAPEDLARAMEGCGALVHAASLVYADEPWPRIRAVNVEGTENVVRAAAAAGLRRGVHLSSVAVYGLFRGEVDEAHPVDQPLRPRERYARSKREAEAVVRKVVGEGGLEAAILRPTALYGERDRLFTPRLARNLRRPLQLLLGSGKTPLAAVYAGNLAAAVEEALRTNLKESFRVFNVAGDFAVTQRDLYRGLGEAMGRRPRFVPLPGPLVRGAARLGDALGLRVPGLEEMTLTRAARLATRPDPYRADRIREELGWAPPVGKAEAMARTAEWLAEQELEGEEPTEEKLTGEEADEAQT